MTNKYVITIIFSKTGRLLLTSSKQHVDESKSCFTGLIAKVDHLSLRETIVQYIKESLHIVIFPNEIKELCKVQYRGNEYYIMCYRSLYEFKTIFVQGLNFHWIKANELSDKSFNIPDFRALVTMAANKITGKSKSSFFEIKYK